MTHKQQREQALIDWINQSTTFRCEKLEMVSGDASFRRYFRFSFSGQSYIAVDAPPEFEDSGKFVDIAQAYKAHNVPVPQIYEHDAKLGFYLQQDFGNAQFADALNTSSMAKLYGQALSHLPAIQSCIEVNGRTLPAFDKDLLDAELYLFTHWLLEVHLNLGIDERQKAMIEKMYDVLRGVFADQPQIGVHRDYHCRNLMILDDNKIGIIDFQDAVIGPLCYDSVSLLRDCYQDWPANDIVEVLQAFHQAAFASIPWAQFKRWFDLTGVQRHIKASGIFCRLYHRDGKDNYLKEIPHTLRYITRVARDYPELSDFADFLGSQVITKMQASLR